MAISFRLCALEDADQLAPLIEGWIGAGRRAADRDTARAGLVRFLGDNRRGHAWIIERHGVPVGYTMLGISTLDHYGAPRGYVTALFVVPVHRERGIGPQAERFLADVTRWLKLPLHQFGTGNEAKHASLLFRPCGLDAARFTSPPSQAVA